LNKNRYTNEKRGIYKEDDYYRKQWNDLLKRDKAKVELFRELNKENYYLIVVNYSINISRRGRYMIQEFIRQTGKFINHANLKDWI